MASVTFPAALGGDGKTYTDDADPNTGLDGLGYVERFVPCLQNAVAMAGYTAQYAAKIDAAAANADRAEDARGYVEAVVDAYSINMLDAYRSKATLDLDFARGLYRVDDGALIETTDPSQLLTISTGVKLAESPDGFLRAISAGELARRWRNGAAEGLVTEEVRTNLLSASENLTASAWVEDGASASLSNLASPIKDANYFEVTSYTTSGRLQNNTASGILSDSRNSASIYLKKGTAQSLRIQLVYVGGSPTTTDINYDFGTGLFSISSDPTNSFEGHVEQAWPDGSVRVVMSVTDVGSNTFLRLYLRLLEAAPSSVYAVGAQIEPSETASSYIPTSNSSGAVTRAADVISTPVSEYLNQYRGSMFWEGRFNPITSGGVSIRGSAGEMLGFGIVSGLFRFFSRDATGSSTINATAIDFENHHRVLICWERVGGEILFKGFLDGALLASQSFPSSFFSEITFFGLNAGSNFAGKPSNMTTKRLIISPLRVSDAEAQELTL